MDENTEYEEVWEGEMDELDMRLETPPQNISLADFLNSRSLSLSFYILCYLARGIGLYRLDAKSFSFVHALQVLLQSIRLHGEGEEGDPTLSRGDYISDLDVDILLEKLGAQKDARLQMLRTIRRL